MTISEATAAPRLSAVGVEYVYEGRPPTRALDGVTLEVRDGEVVAIVGPVGCGKTTFLRIAAGFLVPTRGVVRCDGAVVQGPSGARGYVFQEEAIFPWMTVRENLEFGLLARGVEPAARRASSEEMLRLIRLTDYGDAYPRQLSAGMSKMVEVARVLATGPSLLLLDEPFGALDAQTRARMQEELDTLRAKTRTTMLIVTHDVEEALVLADRVLVFSARPGRVRAEIAVGLPRPRGFDARLAPPFAALKRAVWAALGVTVA